MLENFRLRVFRAVAEHLSFRKAGEQLYLSQPAVTLQIKALEEELGVSVFERSSRGVALSPAGETLLKYAGQLSRLAEEAEKAVAGSRGELTGELIIGASTTIAQYVLPIQLAEFVKRYPGIRLQMFSQNTDRVCEGVAAGEFALGLIEGPARRQDLKITPWFEDELLVAVPRSHEWAELGSVRPERLLQEQLMMRERGSGSRHVIELGLQRAGIRLNELRIAMELDSTEAILSCVEAGLGIGIVSKWAVQRRWGAHTLATVRLEGAAITRVFSFALPQGPAVRSEARTMMHFLRSAHPAAVQADKKS